MNISIGEKEVFDGATLDQVWLKNGRRHGGAIVGTIASVWELVLVLKN